MTETKIFELLRDDFKEVKTSVKEMTGEVAGMKSILKGVNDTLKDHRAAIKETREAQLSCKASGGWVTLNREMKQSREKQSAYQGRIRQELNDLRGDQTGQIDVHAAPVEKRSNGGLSWTMIKTLGPLLLAVFLGILGLGFYLGSNGDEDKALHVMRKFQQEIFLKVDKIEKANAEPVRVPVPVTASDMYLDEVLP